MIGVRNGPENQSVIIFTVHYITIQLFLITNFHSILTALILITRDEYVLFSLSDSILYTDAEYQITAIFGIFLYFLKHI